MELEGEYRIPVAEWAVWEGMNDPDLLKRCIRVCDRFERIEAMLFQAHMHVRIGPFGAGFTVDVRVEDADPPHSYRLVAAGSGGLAGWATATADVRLRPGGSDTLLAYKARADLNGMLARLAARMVEGAAQRYADEFFAEFARQVVMRTQAMTDRASPRS